MGKWARKLGIITRVDLGLSLEGMMFEHEGLKGKQGQMLEKRL